MAPDDTATYDRAVPPVRSGARIAAFATQGTASRDEERLRALLGDLDPELLAFDRARKLRSLVTVVRRLRRDRPELVVMEGTGVAGGGALLLARLTGGPRYVVSTGDAVGPFMGGASRWLRWPFTAYEALLYRHSAGVIGWTPYLVGRALAFGAPRAMTAAGWPPAPAADGARDAVRARLGIPADALVFGIVGSLSWNARYGYCYGLELVRALRACGRGDVRVLVVGGGDGRERLEREADGELGRRLILTGAVDRAAVPELLAAIDVASLPQSVDGVGSVRYTTKLSEYLAAGLPVVTGQIPLAYDLDGGWLWRLAGDAPWDPEYVAALAALMESLGGDELAARRQAVPRALPEFDADAQRRRATAFVTDLLAR
jgi:glycosyltransferase involved in cell wall biosynthesis